MQYSANIFTVNIFFVSTPYRPTSCVFHLSFFLSSMVIFLYACSLTSYVHYYYYFLIHILTYTFTSYLPTLIFEDGACVVKSILSVCFLSVCRFCLSVIMIWSTTKHDMNTPSPGSCIRATRGQTLQLEYQLMFCTKDY